jgi:hypothetical protein
MAKPHFGDLCLILWSDPTSDSEWVLSDEESLEPESCVSVGFFYKDTPDYISIFGSFNSEDIGDRTAIPKATIRSTRILKRGLYANLRKVRS